MHQNLSHSCHQTLDTHSFILFLQSLPCKSLIPLPWYPFPWGPSDIIKCPSYLQSRYEGNLYQSGYDRKFFWDLISPSDQKWHYRHIIKLPSYLWPRYEGNIYQLRYGGGIFYIISNFEDLPYPSYPKCFIPFPKSPRKNNFIPFPHTSPSYPKGMNKTISISWYWREL